MDNKLQQGTQRLTQLKADNDKLSTQIDELNVPMENIIKEIEQKKLLLQESK